MVIMIFPDNRGEITRDDGLILVERTQIGIFCRLSIYVFGFESPVPHFHILKGDPKQPAWETCIKIKQAEYYHHSGKEGVLNKKQKKALVTFLKKMRGDLNVDNWKCIVSVWGDEQPK